MDQSTCVNVNRTTCASRPAVPTGGARGDHLWGAGGVGGDPGKATARLGRRRVGGDTLRATAGLTVARPRPDYDGVDAPITTGVMRTDAR